MSLLKKTHSNSSKLITKNQTPLTLLKKQQRKVLTNQIHIRRNTYIDRLFQRLPLRQNEVKQKISIQELQNLRLKTKQQQFQNEKLRNIIRKDRKIWKIIDHRLKLHEKLQISQVSSLPFQVIKQIHFIIQFEHYSEVLDIIQQKEKEITNNLKQFNKEQRAIIKKIFQYKSELLKISHNPQNAGQYYTNLSKVISKNNSLISTLNDDIISNKFIKKNYMKQLKIINEQLEKNKSLRKFEKTLQKNQTHQQKYEKNQVLSILQKRKLEIQKVQRQCQVLNQKIYQLIDQKAKQKLLVFKQIKNIEQQKQKCSLDKSKNKIRAQFGVRRRISDCLSNF